jgi:putative transposase
MDLRGDSAWFNPANNGHDLHQQVQAYFAYHNHRRPHQSLGGQTPAQVLAQPSFI